MNELIIYSPIHIFNTFNKFNEDILLFSEIYKLDDYDTFIILIGMNLYVYYISRIMVILSNYTFY